MGQENQRGRLQHTDLQTHFLQLQQVFAESNRARAKMENDLVEERQARLHAERTQLASTRAQHEAEEQLGRVWKTTTKVGDLLTMVCHNLDTTPVNMDKSHFNISELLLENESKQARIQKLEAEMGGVDSAGWQKKLEDQALTFLEGHEAQKVLINALQEEVEGKSRRGRASKRQRSISTKC